jgi:hypothetical protein
VRLDLPRRIVFGSALVPLPGSSEARGTAAAQGEGLGALDKIDERRPGLE